MMTGEIEKNNLAIIIHVSKQTSKREKQVIHLIIPKGEGWHYITVKKSINIIQRNNNKKQW